MKSVEIPSDAVFVLIGRATPEGPLVTSETSSEWWEAASPEHKHTMMIKCRQMIDLQRMGIPANRPES